MNTAAQLPEVSLYVNLPAKLPAVDSVVSSRPSTEVDAPLPLPWRSAKPFSAEKVECSSSAVAEGANNLKRSQLNATPTAVQLCAPVGSFKQLPNPPADTQVPAKMNVSASVSVL
jgi:hypothetical protein